MQTKSVIQASANVIRITKLSKGNLFKRMKKEYNDTYMPVFGIVTDIMNDGDNTFIEVMEYDKTYGDIGADIRGISGSDDVSVFPATVQEVEAYFSDSLERIARKIDEAKEQLEKQQRLYDVAKRFIQGEMKKQLTEASFEEIPSQDFKANKELASA